MQSSRRNISHKKAWSLSSRIRELFKKLDGNTGLRRQVIYFRLHRALHAAVIRAAAAFWRNPHNVLRRVFDVTGFAVHAVLRIDLQTVCVVGVFNVLINTGRAVTALRPCIQRQIDVHRHTRIF